MTPTPAFVARWLPGAHALRHYDRRSLRGDIVAGLAVSALLVPQGMAYAQLAGLPAVTGLYTTVIGLIGYALFGPSRILVLGPDSSLAPLIAATILPLVAADGDPGAAIALAGMLAILMGLVCVLAGLARLGAVAELLSMPVRVGYLDGLAIVVVVGQLPKLFGFSTDADGTLAQARAFVEGVADGATDATALLLGAASLVVVVGFRRYLPRVPGVLVAVVGSTLAVGMLGLAGEVSVVGTVPAGLPSPRFPSVPLDDVPPLVVAAVGMAFVTLTDTIALSRTFAAKIGDRVDANREIAALGGANVAAGFFQGFPLCASSSRTAVSYSSGARTQLAGLVGAGVVVALLVFANGLLRDLPSAALAAIVIAAATSLFDLQTLRHLWRVRRSELALALAALVGVVVVGVLEGILVAIVLSIGNFVRRAWYPYDAVLGRLADRQGYHDVDRHPEARQIPGLVLYRFDAPVFFANAQRFARRVMSAVKAHPEPVRRVIIAAEPITDIDTTGAETLATLLDDLEEAEIVLAFAELKGPVKDQLARYGLYDRIGAARFYPTLGRAIRTYVTEHDVAWDDPADGSGGQT